MKTPVAVIVGSIHKTSINKKLAQALTKLGAANFDFTFVPIDKLPMYNQDLESEKPKEVMEFTDAMNKYKTVLIVSPEYNRSVPALLKNAIDWGSRPAVGGSVWKGKSIAVAGTSPGAIGTALAQEHLRHIFGTQGADIMGGELYLQMKPDLIDDAGNISNPDTEKFLKGYMDRFTAFAEKTLAKMAA